MKLATIGYEVAKMVISSFARMLVEMKDAAKCDGILIVDVRRSEHGSWMTKRTLSEALEKYGEDFSWRVTQAKALGNAGKTSVWEKLPGADEALGRLAAWMIKNKDKRILVVLMCKEADINDCHRKAVKKELEAFLTPSERVLCLDAAHKALEEYENKL